ITLTAPNPYSGAFTLNAGDLRLFNRGAITGTSTQLFGFGTNLILDDTGTHWSDRIPDGVALSGNNYGVVVRGNGAATTEEVIGSLTMGLASTITLVPGSGQAVILRSSGVFTRSTASSIVFRGT